MICAKRRLKTRLGVSLFQFKRRQRHRATIPWPWNCLFSAIKLTSFFESWIRFLSNWPIYQWKQYNGTQDVVDEWANKAAENSKRRHGDLRSRCWLHIHLFLAHWTFWLSLFVCTYIRTFVLQDDLWTKRKEGPSLAAAVASCAVYDDDDGEKKALDELFRRWTGVFASRQARVVGGTFQDSRKPKHTEPKEVSNNFSTRSDASGDALHSTRYPAMAITCLKVFFSNFSRPLKCLSHEKKTSHDCEGRYPCKRPQQFSWPKRAPCYETRATEAHIIAYLVAQRIFLEFCQSFEIVPQRRLVTASVGSRFLLVRPKFLDRLDSEKHPGKRSLQPMNVILTMKCSIGSSCDGLPKNKKVCSAALQHGEKLLHRRSGVPTTLVNRLNPTIRGSILPSNLGYSSEAFALS